MEKQTKKVSLNKLGKKRDWKGFLIKSSLRHSDFTTYLALQEGDDEFLSLHTIFVSEIFDMGSRHSRTLPHTRSEFSFSTLTYARYFCSLC
jgi:hypothetical protein